MGGSDSNVRNSDELFVRAHSEVAEVRSESKEDELDGDTVVVCVNDGLVRVEIALPAALLKVNAELMWRTVAQNFTVRYLACDEHDGCTVLQREVNAA